MDSSDTFRKQFDALEQWTELWHQHTQALDVHTRTVERWLRWGRLTWRVVAVMAFGLTLALSLPLQAKLFHFKYRRQSASLWDTSPDQFVTQLQAYHDKCTHDDDWPLNAP
jgi:hypothetical protein